MWGVSLALHVGVIGAFGWLALHSMDTRSLPPKAPPPTAVTLAIDLPEVAEGALVAPAQPDPRGAPPKPFGGAHKPTLDDELRGHGGQPTTSSRPTNLSDRDELAHLVTDDSNRLDRDQQQRLRSSRERASREDRRASKEPMELSFVASGEGARLERRTPSARDPSRGGAASASPSVQGGAPGAEASADGDRTARVVNGVVVEGALTRAAGLGVHDGRVGLDHRLDARVARARPDVILAAVSVPSARRGRPSDDVDSEQEVSLTLRSIVHASTAAGVAGSGTGGAEGGGDPGAGALTGAGSKGRPIGPGDAAWWDLDTNDPGLVPYFRHIHQRLDPLWRQAFPLSAALALRQGTVIFNVTIDASGDAHPQWPPARPSGVPEFDRNCYDAILRGSPYGPIPASLGVSVLHVRMPFDAQNPVVR